MQLATMKSNKAGFTLIEVLVALTILAVTLGAALRGLGVLSNNNHALRLKSLAYLSAENTLIEWRLQQTLPSPGLSTVPCPQGRHALRCDVRIRASQNSNIRQADISVRSEQGETLAQLNGFISGLP